VSDGVRYSLTFAMAFMAFMVVFMDRPEKRPGNLAPIQLITALGAWALIVVNSVVVAVACASASAGLAVAPVATILCAAISSRAARAANVPRGLFPTRSMPSLGRSGISSVPATRGCERPLARETAPSRRCSGRRG
jgi:hypothetical protein